MFIDILIVAGSLAVVITAVALYFINKKKGKTSCGCDCSHCASCSYCNRHNNGQELINK